MRTADQIDPHGPSPGTPPIVLLKGITKTVKDNTELPLDHLLEAEAAA